MRFMRRLHTSPGIFRNALAALLLLSMLAGQWTGLEHRVRHAGLAGTLHHLLPAVPDGASLADVAAQAGGVDGAEEGYAHSCQLFDAATLSAAIHVTRLPGACERAAQDWRLPWPPSSWQAVFIAHFSSRAPPFV